MTKDTEGLWTELARLLEDLRFAPAEGGFEVNDANRRSGAFLSKHGEALLGMLANREAGRLEAQTWQPIETAPKEHGVPILGYADGKMAVVEWWEGLLPGYWSLVVCGSYAEDNEWHPTHWMPIPPALELEGEG